MDPNPLDYAPAPRNRRYTFVLIPLLVAGVLMLGLLVMRSVPPLTATPSPPMRVNAQPTRYMPPANVQPMPLTVPVVAPTTLPDSSGTP